MAPRIPISALGPSALRQIDNFLVAEQMQKEIQAKRKPSKYGSKRVECNGEWFDSMAELDRWNELRLLLRSGQIRDLERQIKYPITINGFHICTWIADFRYVEVETGEPIVEDVKGFKTPVYRIKKKLVEAEYGFKITEVSA